MEKQKTSRTPEGEALFNVMVETLYTFFQLKAVGTREGAVTPSGGGLWGLLRILKLEGLRTVPQIARSRSVTRQHIQKLANEMADAGYVEFINNPDHQRSKLLRLTPKGEAKFQELTDRILDLSEQFARDMDETELRTTAKVLGKLREKLEKI